MTRKDIAADLDRPHFYSQFWIDVAGGKRDITAPAEAAEPADFEADEAEEPEFEEPVKAAPLPKKPAAKAPEKKPEPARPTITSLADLANIDLLMKSSAEMEGEEVPDIETGPASDLAPITTDYPVETLEVEPELLADEEEEDLGDEFEDEEEDEWGNARRPSRQQKPKRRDRPERPERGGRGF